MKNLALGSPFFLHPEIELCKLAGVYRTWCEEKCGIDPGKVLVLPVVAGRAGDSLIRRLD